MSGNSHCKQREVISLSPMKFQRSLCHSGQSKKSKLECSLADFANMTNLIFNRSGL